MGHCSLCGDDTVFMLFRAQWALILGEGLGRKGKKVPPSDPCSASKPTLSRKDPNPPHGTARFPQIGRHRENESLLRPPYITVSSTRTFGPSRKRALPKLSRLSLLILMKDVSVHLEEMEPFSFCMKVIHCIVAAGTGTGGNLTHSWQHDNYLMQAEGSLPDLLLADVGGSPAEVLDYFWHFYPWVAELG